MPSGRSEINPNRRSPQGVELKGNNLSNNYADLLAGQAVSTSELLAIDVFESSSVEAAHDQVLEASGNMESGAIEHRTRQLHQQEPRRHTPETDGIQYHDVTWTAIAQLTYPNAKPLRKNWTADEIAKITPFEGEGVRTTGYLVAFKPQSGGKGEGTNCHLSAPSDTDTHLALVEGVGDAEKSSVVIEFTPRFLKAHPNWSRKVLSPWLNSDNPVRISGWLMLDPDHRNHLNRFRSTLWEIHPITKIEVRKDNQWVDVDKLK
jgi:hypothetical protein